jgi:hypothetical protein
VHREVLTTILGDLGANVIVAPYNPSPQLAWLDRTEHKVTHATYGCNDLLLFTVSKVLTHIDFLRGHVKMVSLQSIVHDLGISHRQLLHASLLAGYMAAQTFPPIDAKNFSFARAAALVVEHESLQAIVDTHTFKTPPAKTTFVHAINLVLDMVEGAVCLYPGGEVRPLRANVVPSPRLMQGKQVVAPVAMFPQVPLPAAASTLLAARLVTAHTLNALVTGQLLDLPLHVPSEEAHTALDWLNTHLRGPMVRLASLAFAHANPLYARAFASIVDGVDPADDWGAEGASLLANTRWSDMGKGVWPRDLVPKASHHMGRLLAAQPPVEAAQKLTVSLFAQAERLAGCTVTFAGVILACASGAQAEAVPTKAHALAVTAVLLVLFSLGFVDEQGALTPLGSALARALTSLPEDAPLSLRESVFTALLLARAEVIDARILTLTSSSPDRSATTPAGKGATEPRQQQVRLLTRVLATLAAEEGDVRAQLPLLNQELCAVTNMAGAVSHALRVSYECALLSAYVFVDGLNARTVDLQEVLALCPCPWTVAADPTHAIILHNALSGNADAVAEYDVAASTHTAKVFLECVCAAVAEAEKTGVSQSVSTVLLQEAIQLL